MRATAPAGNALYEGRVGWSGELGFGVRAPEQGQSGDLPRGDLTPLPEEPVGARDEVPADEPASHESGDHH